MPTYSVSFLVTVTADNEAVAAQLAKDFIELEEYDAVTVMEEIENGD